MEFKLHQLSGSNLKSIFNNAYIDAETLNDSEFCMINGDMRLCVGAYQEQKVLEFRNLIPLPSDFSKEDAQKFANQVNEEMIMLKATIYEPSDDKQIAVFFQYSYVILDHETISGKTIVKLSRMFEDHCKATFDVFANLFQRS